MPGRTGRKSHSNENSTKAILHNGSNKANNNKNGLYKPPPTEKIKEEETKESEKQSLLDDNLIQELMTLAENVVSGQIDAMAKEENEVDKSKSKSKRLAYVIVTICPLVQYLFVFLHKISL